MTRARLVLLMLVLGSGAYLLARASHDDAPVASAQDRASALAAVRERVSVRPSPQLRSGRLAGVAVPPLRRPVIRRSRPPALATATPTPVPSATPTAAAQPWLAGPSATSPTATAPAPAATYAPSAPAPAPAPAPRPTAAPTFDSSGSGPGFDSSG
ncbi:MAG: hypothetical protein QOK21_1811 [Solirubrobacteraceae bacterium]|nr:hypothetical protein [Solirubrobacteraceae bacterium]